MFTSRNSGTMSGYYNLYPNTESAQNPILNNLNEGIKLLGVLIDTMQGGQIILLSESKFFADPDQNLSRVFAQRQPDNYTFIENSIDYLMGDAELVALRSREVLDRPLIELEDSQKSNWKWVNILLPSILIIFFGFIRFRNEKNRGKVLKEIYD